jgi:predicted  nucleic acid-binding Zn-ribbon protein
MGPALESPIDAELAALEEKIRQTVDLCRQLREENRSLRQRLAAAEHERLALEQKIEGTHSRLEHLLQRIPE